MPIRVGEPITAEFLNKLERAAGVRDLTDLPGFSGPDFEAKSTKRTTPPSQRWCKPVAAMTAHVAADVSVKETGPGGDAPTAEVEVITAYPLVDIAADLWCITWTDSDGTDYVSPMECPPPPP